MKKESFSDFITANRLPDRWWVSVDHEVLDNPMCLDEISQLEYEMPGKSIFVLHVACVNSSDADWVEFEFEGMARLQNAISPQAQSKDDAFALHLRIEMIGEEIAELRRDVKELRQAFVAIQGILSEALAMNDQRRELEHRRVFIEQGEEALLQKTIRYEESMAELEQRVENTAAALSA